MVCLWLVGSVEVDLDLERLPSTHYQFRVVVLVSMVLLLVNLIGFLEHMNVHNTQVICRGMQMSREKSHSLDITITKGPVLHFPSTASLRNNSKWSALDLFEAHTFLSKQGFMD